MPITLILKKKKNSNLHRSNYQPRPRRVEAFPPRRMSGATVETLNHFLFVTKQEFRKVSPFLQLDLCAQK